MPQAEALSMVNLSNISKKNKEHLFTEIITASKGREETVDHVQVLSTIAQCLDALTQTDAKEYARKNRDQLTVEQKYNE